MITLSVMNCPATYTLSKEIDDISLRPLWVLRNEGVWLGNAESLCDARTAARLHHMLFGGETLH